MKFPPLGCIFLLAKCIYSYSLSSLKEESHFQCTYKLITAQAVGAGGKNEPEKPARKQINYC